MLLDPSFRAGSETEHHQKYSKRTAFWRIFFFNNKGFKIFYLLAFDLSGTKQSLDIYERFDPYKCQF